MKFRFCILKGKTTNLDQFSRFLDSIENALEFAELNPELTQISFYAYLDTEGRILEQKLRDLSKYGVYIHVFYRDADPGDLRNEFLAKIRSEYKQGDEYKEFYFGFFDGDDEVSWNYFDEVNAYANLGAKIMLLLPEAVYGDKESDCYPMKWDLAVSQAKQEGKTILDLALEDSIGGQAWGKLYHEDYLHYNEMPIFGRGLYEDVRFWYTVASKIRGWSEVAVTGARYRWRRDNPVALTRTSPDVPSILQGLENLNYARSQAIKLGYEEDDVRVWKRYTMGIVDLIKHIYRSGLDDRNKMSILRQIMDKIKISSFRLGKLNVLDHGFIERTDKDILIPHGTTLCDIAQLLVKESGIVL